MRKGPSLLISAIQKAASPTASRSGQSPRGSVYGLRLALALALVAACALLAGSWLRLSEERNRLALGAARSENHALKVRQEALRSELFEASRRLEALELGERDPDRGRGST